jgi:outer membrane receptor protein involved in Fe transport
MNKQIGRSSLTLSGAVAMILAAAAAGAQGTPASEASQKTDLGEVFVTAQKRMEALAEIPMSVSVVSGDALERQQADNFQDLVSLVPGLSINTNTRGVTRITLRGINTGGVASTVGVYVNDVPFGSSSGLANGSILSGDFDTFDLARVEVLRGPQGTLYGASSLGGVIKYVANEPSLSAFEARVQATTETVTGGDIGYSAAGVLNVPLSGTAAIRASGYYRMDDGFIDSIGNNPIPSLQNPAVNIVDGSRVESNLNSLDTYGGRLSALFQPSDSFSLNLTALYQNIESDSSDAFEANPNNYEPLYGGLVASRYHPEFTDIEYRVYSASLDWDFGAATLESVTSYSEFKQEFQRDYAVRLSLAQLLTFFFSDPVTAQPPMSAILNQITATDKFTQELRLVSPADQPVEWLVGLYYTEEDSGIDPQTITAVNAGTETPVAGLPVLADGSLTSTFEELALFANATWHVTDRVDLSFGGRISENDQKASQSLDGLLVGTQTFDDVKSSESPFTYSFSPRWKLTENTSTYLRVATGYRPGGPNVLPPGAPPGTPASYDSDQLTSYEIGVKTESDSGAFTLDAAAYYLDWDDIQLFALINNIGLNANGGKAKSKGIEFTATARHHSGLLFTFNGAYTDAYLTEDTDPVVGGLDGDPLPWVPEWSYAVGADYEWAVSGNATAYVGGRLGFTGNRTADFSNRDSSGNIREAGSYATIDLRAGVDAGRWTIELYGKNLTNERGINDIAEPGSYPNGAVGIGVIRPATIGVSLGARF